MELFGIGIWELILIVLIALIVLGPQDTVRAGRSLGRAVRRFFSSEEWRTMLKATREIRTIPDKLMEETGLDHPEEFIPSEAEIRQEAGLDDLQQNMAQWQSDITTMSKEAGPEQILPPGTLPTKAEIGEAGKREAGLEDLERDLSEWKADLSAWGTSSVIIPVPSNPTSAPPGTPAPATAAPSTQTASAAASGSAEEGTAEGQTAPPEQAASNDGAKDQQQAEEEGDIHPPSEKVQI